MSDQATFVTFDNIVNSWRQRVLFFIDTSVWGRLWDTFDFLLNMCICVIYIVNTTFTDEHDDPSRIPESTRVVEFIVAVVFLAQYIVRYVVINANHRSLEHAVVFFAFVAPVAAYFMSISDEDVRNSYMSAGVMAIFYPARFLRLHYAINRMVALAASSPAYFRLTLIRQEVVSLCSDIIVAILFFSSLVYSGVNWYCQANDVDYEGFSFLDAIYSIVMSGMGEDGSIPPSTFFQLISMAVLALIALAVPSRISRLVDVAMNTSTYTKTVALPAASRHALLCGHIEIASTRQFLHEFFNADHGPNIFKTTIVILHSDEPSMEMKTLLRDPMYANRVFYVKGVDIATCVYILTRKSSRGSGVEEDAETVLIALALSAFSTPFVKSDPDVGAQAVAPKFHVYAQTILPESIEHLTYLQTTRIACVDEMRLGIMAQNCATPGFAALAFMLSTSVADKVDWDYSGILTEDIAASSEDSWVQSYIHGINQEIYQAHVPSSLMGKSFFKAARYFYRCHGLLIIGVGIYSKARSPHSHIGHHPSVVDSGYYQVVLAPRSYVLQKRDMLFAIATDVQSVLNAVMYAERVSMRSQRVGQSTQKPEEGGIQRSIRDLVSTGRSDGVINPFQRSIRDLVTSGGGREKDDYFQLDSPRRMVVRTGTPRGRGVGRRINYISDSDSSCASAARGVETMGRSDDAASVKGAVRTRVERVAERSDRVPALRNHIVVCDASGTFPRSIELLIQALKHAFEDDGLAVVVLSPAAADEQLRLVLADFTRVFVVHGTPLSQSDLKRTHITRAQKAIVLAGGLREGEPGDAAAILANMNIQQLCGGQFFVTTELLDIDSIRYLDHTQLLGEPLLKRTFMGGHIFMPALLDTVLCQCYFSSHIIDVLRHLTFSHQPRALEAPLLRPYRPGRLSLLYVPSRFVGRRYDTLVLTLLKHHGAVALGLYRVVSHAAQAFAAVMCNPRPALPLLASDAVYVLGSHIPGWTHVTESLGAVEIATAPMTQTPSPPDEKDSKGHTTTTSQSRHTVYSHNTDVHDPDQGSGAFADESDAGAHDHNDDHKDDDDGRVTFA
ncbi:hypothetical protein GGF46_001671 [Coemansia sp. RSA 552]|nr:hypothetical protein GGF46_001671 [Coemansia sp. RSA 552]